MLLFYSVIHRKHCNTDPAVIYTARNSLRLHPAQVKLIQVSLCYFKKSLLSRIYLALLLPACRCRRVCQLLSYLWQDISYQQLKWQMKRFLSGGWLTTVLHVCCLLEILLLTYLYEGHAKSS